MRITREQHSAVIVAQRHGWAFCGTFNSHAVLKLSGTAAVRVITILVSPNGLIYAV